MTQLTDLDYETIENAVMETARGRWFLSEHQKRHRGTEPTGTPALLDAISRLEKVVTSISKDFPPQESVKAETTRPAIMPAPVKASGTLKFHAPQAPDQAQTPAQAQPQTQTKPLSQENLQFFANDEDLFAEEANALMPDTTEKNSVTNSPEKAAVPAKPDAERFKIFKVSPPNSADNKDAQDSQRKTAKAPAAAIDVTGNVPDLTMQPTAEEQDRIIVIRNAADSDINIPQAEDFTDNYEGPASPEKSTSPTP